MKIKNKKHVLSEVEGLKIEILTLLFAFFLLPFSLSYAATGCSYPVTLDSWPDKGTGDYLTIADVNQRSCAIEKLQSGPIRPNKGTVGAPAYSFQGDTDTGVDSLALDQLNFITAGVSRGLVNSSGLTLTALTANSFLYSGAAGLLTSTVAPTHGQLLIGSTGAAPVRAALTAGDNITITNAAGGITIAGTGVTILDKVTADTTVANTITETTIYTFSVPGGTLSTNNRLRLVIQAKQSTANGAFNHFVDVRLKYGATTLITSAVGNYASAVHTDKAVFLEFILSADGATNAQLGMTRITAEDTLGVDGTSNRDTHIKRGTSAIDSTAAQNLVVTVQWNTANASNSITMEHAILEKLI